MAAIGRPRRLPPRPVLAMLRAMDGQAALVTVQVNGEPRGLPAGATVADLLAAIGLDARKVAVERNREIVPRSAYATTGLAEADVIEIVHFIGGG